MNQQGSVAGPSGWLRETYARQFISLTRIVVADFRGLGTDGVSSEGTLGVANGARLQIARTASHPATVPVAAESLHAPVLNAVMPRGSSTRDVAAAGRPHDSVISSWAG